MTRTDFFNWFFGKSKRDFDRLEELDNGLLMALLDDIVECFAMENSGDWACKQDIVKWNFRKLKNEIYNRMK